MKILTTLCVLLMMLIALSCSSVAVKHDYDREANFASIKSFDWMPKPKNMPNNAQRVMQRNPLLDKRIRNAVNDQLAAKGLRMTSSAPDILIAYHTGVQDKIDVTDWGYSYARVGRYYAVGRRRIEVEQYKQGTLILDFIDRKSKELVWRGTATGALPDNPTPEKMEKKINEAVAKVLEKFPPAAGETT